MKKHIYFITILFLSTSFILFSFDLSADKAFFKLYTLGLTLLIEFLRKISLHSSIGNIIAWILLIFISVVPMICARVWRKSIPKGIRLISVSFSTVIFFTFFASLRSYFTNEFTQLDITIIINSAITSIYLCFILGMLYLHVTKEREIEPIRLLKLFVLITIYISTFFMGVIFVKTARELALSDYVSLPEFMFINIRQILLLFLQIKIYRAVPMSLNGCFELRFNQDLKKIQSYSSGLFLFIIVGTIVSSLFKLLSLKTLDNTNFDLNLPFFELGICIFLQIIVSLVSKGLEFKEENEQFI